MKNEVQVLKDPDVGWKFWKKRRYILGLLVFIGFFILILLQVNLHIAIVVMTSNTINGKAEFDWDPKLQGVILSGFFYGYILSQFFGGWLSARIQAKLVLGYGILITSLLTIMTPLLARKNVYFLIVLRITEGIFQGVTFPCSHAIWAKWAPPLERSRLGTLALSGTAAGTIPSMFVSSLIAKYLNCPAIFYIYGIAGIIWFVFWSYLVTDDPANDPWITKSELDYINQSLNNDSHNKTEEKVISHPWKSILSSPAVWAIFAANFCDHWGYETMMILLPIYMNDVLHFDIEETGYFSALPFVGEFLVMFFASYLADYMVEMKYLTTTQVRKVLNSACFVQAIAMVLAGYLRSAVGVITCFTIAITIGGFSDSSYAVNYLDIAPQHASVMMGIGNTLGTIPGIISPSLSVLIVANNTAAEWRIVFIIIACIYVIGGVVYIVFSSGEKQPWADNLGEIIECPETKKKEDNQV